MKLRHFYFRSLEQYFLKKAKKASSKKKLFSDFYFQNIQQYLLKRGKKETLEKIFCSYLLSRSKKNKQPLNFFLYQIFDRVLCYFKLNLKKKRRIKVKFLEKNKIQKQTLLSFSKLLRKSGKSEKNFISLFEKELNALVKRRSSILINRKHVYKTVRKLSFLNSNKKYKFF